MPLHSLPLQKARQKQQREHHCLPHPHAAFPSVPDTALMRIFHVPLINSLNLCTDEQLSPFYTRTWCLFTFAQHIRAQPSRNTRRSLLHWSSLCLFGSEVWTCEQPHLSASADLQKTCSALNQGEIDPAGLFTSSTHLGVHPQHLRVVQLTFLPLPNSSKICSRQRYNHREGCSQFSQLIH